MSVATERELALRVSDLENAMKTIGRIAVDSTITPKARLQRVGGVLSMFGCESTAAPALPLTSNPQPPTTTKEPHHA